MKVISMFFILLVASSFTLPVDEVKLEYKFKAGDQYDYLQKSKQIVKQSIPGMGEMTMNMDMDATMLLKVSSLTATGAKIEAQFKKLKMVSTSMMGNTSMDSESTGDDTQNKIARSLIGKTFFFYLTKKGGVEKIENTENLYSGLSGLGLDEATLKQTKQSLQQALGEKSLKASIEMGFINYPENKVKSGDSWNHTAALALNFPMQIENKWNLKSIQGNVASVDADGNVTTTDKDKVTTLPNGIKSKVDLNGRQALVGKVDIKSGWPTEIKVLSEIKGTMLLLAGGMIPTDMDVPMEIESEVSYSIIKK